LLKISHILSVLFNYMEKRYEHTKQP
jgi:hypothetical protein